ncbi:MAG: tetratricopeptide repeat protein [Candidatus Caenarcaniphilales bacterium]|nr:tetratricopeptide repeat protein [Candidatus Caenarcaniphilales bacterium]
MEAKSNEELFFRALAKQNLGNLPGALSDFDQVLTLDPNDVDTLVTRCGLLSDMGQFAAAIESCKKAIQLGAGQSVYFNLGIAQQGLGDLQGSINSFKTAADFSQRSNNQDLNQKSTQRLELLQRVARRELSLYAVNQFLNAADLALAGNTSQAIRIYEGIIRQTPNFAEAHLELANCLALQKNYQAALKEYQIAERLNPNSISTYNNRAAIWIEAEGNYKNARADLVKARSLAQTQSSQNQNSQDLVKFLDQALAEVDLMEKAARK